MKTTRLPYLLVIGLSLSAGCAYEYERYSPPPISFSGSSEGLKHTAVVPTTGCPTPRGKNVIWCGTFQLAWDQFRKIDGVKVEQVVPDPQAVARMNASPMDPADLPERCFYAAAGRTKEGIIEKIQQEMHRRFSSVQPHLPQGNIDALAYAYLAANVKFGNVYFTRPRGDDFVDSTGKHVKVSTFGLYHDSESSVNERLAGQIQILYSNLSRDRGQIKTTDRPAAEFVLDLDRNSSPSQLILACVEPGATLAETWQQVQRKIADWKPSHGEGHFSPQADTLAVPNLNFLVAHHFAELEKNPLLGTYQSVNFRLDRSGAALVSEAYVCSLGGVSLNRQFHFTRPFLIAMRKRGAATPYFLMWVDNAELLCRLTEKS